MTKWNASMPMEKTPAGLADVVIAYRTSTGQRVEFECSVAQEDALALMSTAMLAAQKSNSGRFK